MEIETAARHGQRRRIVVTGQGSSSDGNANCFIARIPEDILSEIFLKLDGVRSLIRCRRVCKSWRRIIFSQLFAQSFQAKRPEPIVICRGGKLFYFIQGQEVSIAAISSHHHKGSNSTRTSSPPVIHLVNSCNGLLCMTICSGRVGDHDKCSLFKRRCHGETIFIVNPITSEYIALPSCGQDVIMDMCGLGFCAQTNEFKVLRILSKTSDEYSSKVVQVYTIGSGKWRSVDVDMESLNIVFPPFYRITMLTFFNGSLYWINDLDPEGGVFVAFDFAKEQFEQSSEEILDDLRELGHITGLGTFKDHLSLFCYVPVGHRNSLGSSRDALKLYLLNKDGSYKDRKSSYEFSVQSPMEFRRSKERVIQWFENGTILFRSHDYLYSFVMKGTRKFKKYSQCMIRLEEDVVVHVPSFLSLKDVVKGQISLVQKLGSNRGQRNELDVVVQKEKSLAELQEDAVLRDAFLREKGEEIRVLRQRLSRYKTRWPDGVADYE